jgi:hypothetical protein
MVWDYVWRDTRVIVLDTETPGLEQIMYYDLSPLT